MSELLVELLIESGILAAGFLFVLGFLVEKYIADTKHQRTVENIIDTVVEASEDYDIDIPKFLDDILLQLHDVDLKTLQEEGKLMDKINELITEKKLED